MCCHTILDESKERKSYRKRRSSIVFQSLTMLHNAVLVLIWMVRVMVVPFIMETSQRLCGEIIALHTEGYSNADIARQFGVSQPTVALWICWYQDTGATNNQPRCGRPRCKTQEEGEVSSVFSLCNAITWRNCLKYSDHNLHKTCLFSCSGPGYCSSSKQW